MFSRGKLLANLGKRKYKERYQRITNRQGK